MEWNADIDSLIDGWFSSPVSTDSGTSYSYVESDPYQASNYDLGGTLGTTTPDITGGMFDTYAENWGDEFDNMFTQFDTTGTDTDDASLLSAALGGLKEFANTEAGGGLISSLIKGGGTYLMSEADRRAREKAMEREFEMAKELAALRGGSGGRYVPVPGSTERTTSSLADKMVKR